MSLVSLSACAQSGNNSGPLPFPKPYGDRGTTTLGNPPIRYQTRTNPNQNPVEYWRSRIISSPNYYNESVIIIAGTPCYAPYYYGYGLSGFYNNLQVERGSRPNGSYVEQDNYSDPANSERYAEPQLQRRYAQPAAPASSRGSTFDDSSYYLHKRAKPKTAVEKDPLLAEAVADIEYTFRSGEIARLEKHIVATDTLTIQAKGRTRKPLAASAYLQMTREALADMKTTRYELNKVEPASNGAWMVYGTHVLRNEDGKDKTFSVAFVLKKSGDKYVVTEVSADPV
jgi:hypothetical protein